MLQKTWETQWGEVDPYNFVTQEQYLEDMNHVLNDRTLKKRALSWLPYLFKVIFSFFSIFIKKLSGNIPDIESGEDRLWRWLPCDRGRLSLLFSCYRAIFISLRCNESKDSLKSLI